MNRISVAFAFFAAAICTDEEFSLVRITSADSNAQSCLNVCCGALHAVVAENIKNKSAIEAQLEKSPFSALIDFNYPFIASARDAASYWQAIQSYESCAKALNCTAGLRFVPPEQFNADCFERQSSVLQAGWRRCALRCASLRRPPQLACESSSSGEKWVSRQRCDVYQCFMECQRRGNSVHSLAERAPLTRAILQMLQVEAAFMWETDKRKNATEQLRQVCWEVLNWKLPASAPHWLHCNESSPTATEPPVSHLRQLYDKFVFLFPEEIAWTWSSNHSVPFVPLPALLQDYTDGRAALCEARLQLGILHSQNESHLANKSLLMDQICDEFHEHKNHYFNSCLNQEDHTEVGRCLRSCAGERLAKNHWLEQDKVLSVEEDPDHRAFSTMCRFYFCYVDCERKTISNDSCMHERRQIYDEIRRELSEAFEEVYRLNPSFYAPQNCRSLYSSRDVFDQFFQPVHFLYKEWQLPYELLDAPLLNGQVSVSRHLWPVETRLLDSGKVYLNLGWIRQNHTDFLHSAYRDGIVKFLQDRKAADLPADLLDFEYRLICWPEKCPADILCHLVLNSKAIGCGCRSPEVCQSRPIALPPDEPQLKCRLSAVVRTPLIVYTLDDSVKILHIDQKMDTPLEMLLIRMGERTFEVDLKLKLGRPIEEVAPNEYVSFNATGHLTTAANEAEIPVFLDDWISGIRFWVNRTGNRDVLMSTTATGKTVAHATMKTEERIGTLLFNPFNRMVIRVTKNRYGKVSALVSWLLRGKSDRKQHKSAFFCRCMMQGNFGGFVVSASMAWWWKPDHTKTPTVIFMKQSGIWEAAVNEGGCSCRLLYNAALYGPDMLIATTRSHICWKDLEKQGIVCLNTETNGTAELKTFRINSGEHSAIDQSEQNKNLLVPVEKVVQLAGYNPSERPMLPQHCLRVRTDVQIANSDRKLLKIRATAVWSDRLECLEAVRPPLQFHFEAKICDREQCSTLSRTVSPLTQRDNWLFEFFIASEWENSQTSFNLTAHAEPLLGGGNVEICKVIGCDNWMWLAYRIPAKPLPWLMIAIGTLFGMLLLVLLAVCALFMREKLKMRSLIYNSDGIQLIPPNSIWLGDQLAEGFFGKCSLAEWTNNDKNTIAVVVKSLKRLSNETHRRRFQQEALIMSTLDHQNIAKLYGVSLGFSDEKLVLEYVRGGSLSGLLKENEGMLRLTLLCRFMLDAAEALTYLHEQHSPSMLHNDIKPANCLVVADHFDQSAVNNFSAPLLKLCDFGLASIDGYTSNSHREKPIPTPPEIVNAALDGGCIRFTTRSDVWMFGVLCSKVLNYCSTMHLSQLLSMPERVPEELSNMISQCTSSDEAQRPLVSSVRDSLRALLPTLPANWVRGANICGLREHTGFVRIVTPFHLNLTDTPVAVDNGAFQEADDNFGYDEESGQRATSTVLSPDSAFVDATYFGYTEETGESVEMSELETGASVEMTGSERAPEETTIVNNDDMYDL